MANTIEACKRSRAKLVFFDNVYMYGQVNGAMTEETPFNSCSKKREVRAEIATAIKDEWKAGALTAMIARAADFYGPETPNGLPTLRQWLRERAGSKSLGSNPAAQRAHGF